MSGTVKPAPDRREQCPAADHRERVARHPRADRRRSRGAADARHRFERVINTRALIMREQGDPHLLSPRLRRLAASRARWAARGSGPSSIPPAHRPDRRQLARAAQVDLLDGGDTKPKPSLASGVPTIYVSETPAELIVFRGAPTYTAIPGRASNGPSNTRADVIFDGSDRSFYVLLAGRWYRAPALDRARGPSCRAASLPADFRRIPPESPAGVVLAAVAGTPQAQEAVIANSIPQTATIPRVNGPVFTAVFDGAPQIRPIEGTRAPVRRQLADADHRGEPRRASTRCAPACGSGRPSLSRPVDRGGLVPRGHLRDSAHLAAALRHVRPRVRVDGEGGLCRLYAGLPGHGRRARRRGRVRHRLYLLSPGSAPRGIRRPPPTGRGPARLQPGRRHGLRLRHGGDDRGRDGRLLSPGLLSPATTAIRAAAPRATTLRPYGNTTRPGTRSYYANSPAPAESASGNYTNYRTGTSGKLHGQRSSTRRGDGERGYTRTSTRPAARAGGVDSQQTYNASTGRYSYSLRRSATGRAARR